MLTDTTPTTHTTRKTHTSAAKGARRNWQDVHEHLVALAKQRAELDVDEGRWMLAALRAQVHVHLGYGSFQEYVERLFGYGPRFVAQRLRVAHALEQLPVMREAVAAGSLCWSAARELTRVATAQTERAWCEAASGKTVRQLEQLVSGLAPGSLPTDRREARYERHVLRLELSAETYATYREAVATLQKTSGGGLDDDAALLLMARTVLAGPADDGRAGYQIAVSVCPQCREAVQHGRGEAVPVQPEILEMAACDAQVVAVPCTQLANSEAPGRPTWASSARASSAATAKAPSESPAAAARFGRASQTIPPAVRREVMRRDGGACAVPGCRNATFVDVHHVWPRADGGTHDPDRMLVLCSAHHRATHRGALIIEGAASAGFAFMHADGSTYGAGVLPAAAAAGRDAFLALRGLGFGETAVRQALAVVRGRGGADLEAGQLVRAALQQLRPARSPAMRPQWVREAPVAYVVTPTEVRTAAAAAAPGPEPRAATGASAIVPWTLAA